MMKVAVLVADELYLWPDDKPKSADVLEYEDQLSKLVLAFAEVGLQLEAIRWREASARVYEYDAMLPLFAWDYPAGNNLEVFLAEMERVSTAACGSCKLFNSVDILRWNANKCYLGELEQAGAPSIPTVMLEKVTEDGIAKAIYDLRTDTVVIKPKVGGSSWRQVLYCSSKKQPFPTTEELPPGEAMVQPFLASVVEEGEYSLLFFDGSFSHAVVKRAKDGEYKIQSIFGGTDEPYQPTEQELSEATQVLDAVKLKCGTTPLYARIDLLRGFDGGLKLIEAELLEPYLYFPQGDDIPGARMLAESLARKMTVEQSSCHHEL